MTAFIINFQNKRFNSLLHFLLKKGMIKIIDNINITYNQRNSREVNESNNC